VIKGFKGSSEMRKFEFNSKFRLWRFRIGHSELLFEKRGFTLIEIIVLIVIAGIIIPVIVVPFATGIRGSGKPEVVTTAMYLAHQKMEELMKFDYSRAPELTPGTYILPAPPIAGYTWQWVISYVTNTFAASGADVGYKMIQVTVTDPQGITYNVYSVVTNFP
jgi:prepilin-type N-terminal cleavage/methylation domain-containing protein